MEQSRIPQGPASRDQAVRGSRYRTMTVVALAAFAVFAFVGFPGLRKKDTASQLENSPPAWVLVTNRLMSCEWRAALEDPSSVAWRQSFAEGVPDNVKITGLNFLGRWGSKRAVFGVLPLLSEESEAVGSAAEAALSQCLSRHGETIDRQRVARVLRASRSNVSARARALRAVFMTRGSEAPGLLADWLGSSSEMDVMLLQNAPTMALMNDEHAQVLRTALAEGLVASNPNVRRECARLVGGLREDLLAPELVKLLNDESQGVRENAHWALRSMSSLNFPSDSKRWKLWLDGEQAWWKESGHRMRHLLASTETRDVLEALQGISGHPLFLSPFRAGLEKALSHRDGNVRRQAVCVLHQLRSQASVPAIIACLDDQQRGVAYAAHEALKALTGRRIPQDPDAWKKYWAATQDMIPRPVEQVASVSPGR